VYPTTNAAVVVFAAQAAGRSGGAVETSRQRALPEAEILRGVRALHGRDCAIESAMARPLSQSRDGERKETQMERGERGFREVLAIRRG
tara:strand:+ start:191 stop:457 length:267 start_codon:yes stop_codon:yes gene_type:complete